MKKKIIALCLVVVLAVTAITGVTLAYFTDTEGAKNVMTVGNVSIVQEETNEKGEAFQNGQKLFPYTGEDMMDIDTLYYKGTVRNVEKNWISKIVTVFNDGSEDAYVRTLFAFEILKDDEGNDVYAADPDTGDLAYRLGEGLYWKLSNGKDLGSVHFPKVNGQYIIYTAADGTKYMVGEYLYYNNDDSMLKSGERSHPSMKSVALEDYVDNDVASMYKDYEILVVSQAVQTKGFTDVNGNGVICDDALNTAFGALEAADQAKLAAEHLPDHVHAAHDSHSRWRRLRHQRRRHLRDS